MYMGLIFHKLINFLFDIDFKMIPLNQTRRIFFNRNIRRALKQINQGTLMFTDSKNQGF
jgi:hypothetical protein